ncbi:hypothetical protein Pla144_04050 [Bythopirellula polymerisocia]|uniref:Uncharacterized protein n=1 Tax=Bythopirellula polymerisocia TaxID=2528003 RepID=A0A5C6D1U7_9BACT|nr:hypothetical protein Pla144_04050 [Bythopirellula polymerisocia]
MVSAVFDALLMFSQLRHAKNAANVTNVNNMKRLEVKSAQIGGLANGFTHPRPAHAAPHPAS